MKEVELIPLKSPINASVDIAGCVSYTVRALNLAAMTHGSVTITNPLKSDDTYAMFNILKDLGVNVEEQPDAFIVHGHINDIKDGNYELNVNISGRTARTSLGLLCIVPGIKTVICEEGFKKRPVGDLVDGLRQLGAEIEYLEEEGFLPVKITSSTLNPGKVKMNGEVSSQYFSSIIMIAPLVGEIDIEVIGEQSSKPFIDITIDIMKTFGVEVENANYKSYLVKAPQKYTTREYTVEADAIAATYFWSIAAVTGSTIRVNNLSPLTAQGDARYVDILEQMGCKVSSNAEEKWIEVTGAQNLIGVNVNMNDRPDSVQSLAVTAVFAQGTTKVDGIAHLKYKETNRIEAPVNELKKMGVTVASDDDSLEVTGGTAHGTTIETYGDHRMAMAFAIAGSKMNGIKISKPSVVNKSYPEFWNDLKKLGIGVIYHE